jgi:hypothetical protein
MFSKENQAFLYYSLLVKLPRRMKWTDSKRQKKFYRNFSNNSSSLKHEKQKQKGLTLLYLVSLRTAA